MANEFYQIRINKDTCVGCGLCVKDCVGGNIELKDGKASIIREKCIFCGHCEAICPRNAVKIAGFSDEPIEMAQVRLNPRQLMDAIRTRRSVRSFTEEEVTERALNDILEAGRLAPTGGNSQGTSYIVLQEKKDELEAMAVKLFRSIAGLASPLSSYIKGMNIDDAFFFKGAPVAIVIVGDKVNASLAAENMAFMAEAHGLGVLYSGFFTMCANMNPEIHSALGMKHREKAVTTLVIGHSAVKYQRTVRRKEASIRRL